jgi:hypothetical protein
VLGGFDVREIEEPVSAPWSGRPVAGRCARRSRSVTSSTNSWLSAAAQAAPIPARRDRLGPWINHVPDGPETGAADAHRRGRCAGSPALPLAATPFQDSSVRDPPREEEHPCCLKCPPVGEVHPAECTAVGEQPGHRPLHHFDSAGPETAPSPLGATCQRATPPPSGRGVARDGPFQDAFWSAGFSISVVTRAPRKSTGSHRRHASRGTAA